MKIIIAFLLLLAVDITNLQAQTFPTVSRQANWTDNSNNETNFIVQQCPGICLATSTLWKTIGTVGQDVTTFIVGPMPVPSTTSYRVAAQNTAGTSPFSAIVVDDLPAPIPPVIIPIPPTIFPLPPCKSLTEILPSTTPKRYLCT